MKKYILFIISLIILSFSYSSFACSCIMPPNPEISEKMFSNIFIGKVININKSILDKYNNEVSFEVYNIIKGEYKKKLTINTSSSSASCGYNFENSKEYIVYANKNKENGDLQVSLCSRTNLLEKAGEDLKEYKNIIEGKKEIIKNNIKPSVEKNKNIFLITLFILSVIIFIFFISKKD